MTSRLMELPQGDGRLLGSQVARIAVRPTWVGVLDPQTRLPGVLAGEGR